MSTLVSATLLLAAPAALAHSHLSAECRQVLLDHLDTVDRLVDGDRADDRAVAKMKAAGESSAAITKRLVRRMPETLDAHRRLFRGSEALLDCVSGAR